MFGADLGVVLFYAAMIMLLFMVIWLLIGPLKLLNKFLINAMLGLLCIFIYNFIGNYIGYGLIGINEITALIVSVLGVPGFIAIVIIKGLILI